MDRAVLAKSQLVFLKSLLEIASVGIGGRCQQKIPPPPPYFFPYNLSAGKLSSVYKINFFAKILFKIFYFASIISVCSTPL
jgi:hypothetical protein